MPELARLLACKLCIYAGDHAPPHFHIRSAGFAAIVEIASLTLVKGKTPRKALLEVGEWADRPENLARLHAEWNRLNDY